MPSVVQQGQLVDMALLGDDSIDWIDGLCIASSEAPETTRTAAAGKTRPNGLPASLNVDDRGHGDMRAAKSWGQAHEDAHSCPHCGRGFPTPEDKDAHMCAGLHAYTCQQFRSSHDLVDSEVEDRRRPRVGRAEQNVSELSNSDPDV